MTDETTARPRPATDMQVETRMFDDDGVTPNNPHLPVVLMRGAFVAGGDPATVCKLLAENGWGRNWVWTVFAYHHYHPNAHEALAVVAGQAELQLGGESGVRFQVAAGDCIVLPAGTGHCRICAGADFAICGGYPSGQDDYETRRSEPRARGDATTQIAAVPLPRTDPVFGAGGPLVEIWSR